MKLRELLFLSVSALVFVAALTFVFLGLRAERAAVRFRADIGKIDSLIQENRDGRAEAVDLVRRATRAADSAGDWLSLTKRAYQLSDAELAREVSRRGFDEYPGNEALSALAAHAAMRAGDVDSALEVVHIVGPRFEAVKAEAYLRGGLLWETVTTGPGALTRVVESENPEDYLLAAEITGEGRFQIDAALLYLRRGNYERALREIGSLPQGEVAALGIRASYDAEDDRAFSRYVSVAIEAGVFDAEAKLLYAQKALHDGAVEEAMAVYSEVADRALAVNNFAVLLYDRDPAAARTELTRAVERFPESSFILANHVRVLWNDPSSGDEVRRLAAVYRNRLPRGGVLAALDLAITRSSNDPPNRIAVRAWQLHEAVDDPGPVARYLAWYLYGLRDSAGVLEVANREAHRERDWAALYRAAYAASDGRIEEALEELRGRTGPWEVPFNRSIILAASGSHEQALTALRDALEVLDGRCRGCLEDRALILFRRAVSLATLGRRAEAVAAAAQAVNLDPTRAEARQLLASLES